MNSGMFGRKWQRCGGHQQRQRQHRGQQQGTSLRGRGRQWRVSKWRVPLRRVRAGRSHNDRAAKWTGRGWGRGRGRGRGWRIDAPRGVRDIQDPESQLGWQHKADSRIASMERSCLTAKIWLALKTSDNILNFKADSRIASMERSCLTAKIASKTSDNILNFSYFLGLFDNIAHIFIRHLKQTNIAPLVVACKIMYKKDSNSPATV